MTFKRAVAFVAAAAAITLAFGAGMLADRVLETPEERLARRVVAAERSIEACREAEASRLSQSPLVLTDDDLIAAFTHQSTADVRCAVELEEWRVADTAARLWKRR